MTDLAFRLEGVRKCYPRFTLGAIDLALPEGTTMGLVGPNGAGKSTLLRMLMGLIRPDAGRVTVLDLPMPAQERRVKQDVGFVSEDMSLYGDATLDWHLRLVRSFHPGWDAAYAARLAERFDLDLRQKARGLSRGQTVKALLLLALARRPKLLLLDEPTTGLDPLVRSELVRELAALAREAGHSVLFSSHHTADVEELSERVTFLHQGRIVETGLKAEMMGPGQTLEGIFLACIGTQGQRRAA